MQKAVGLKDGFVAPEHFKSLSQIWWMQTTVRERQARELTILNEYMTVRSGRYAQSEVD